MKIIGQYLSTFALTRGLALALLASLFLYGAAWGLHLPLLYTLTTPLYYYLLLRSGRSVWFWTGFWTGLLWFWWIGLSFLHYKMAWMIPLVLLAIATVYGTLFYIVAAVAEKSASLLAHYLPSHLHTLLPLLLKGIGLLVMSYIHPFGFDWFKPELLMVESYFGIDKIRFALIIFTLVLTIYFKRPLILLLLFAAIDTKIPQTLPPEEATMRLLETHIDVKSKWDESKQPAIIKSLLHEIDRAIVEGKRAIVLPESAFPVFINYDQTLFDALRKRAEKITIVTGGLYLDKARIPRNSTYIFTKGKITVANKVVLVPFGEANPLPDFLGKWINRFFYGDATDYRAAKTPADYTVEDKRFRNAICYEATSERLYDPPPKRMMVLSNNGWFVPSIEPTLQRLLLEYYSRKYGTIIYHSTNMSPAYIIVP